MIKLRVICVGLSRTGTSSLKAELGGKGQHCLQVLFPPYDENREGDTDWLYLQGPPLQNRCQHVKLTRFQKSEG